MYNCGQRISPCERTESRHHQSSGRQRSWLRQGKQAGYHRGLRAGHVPKRVIRELGRASRLLGNNSRREDARLNQHPGIYRETRPMDEPNPTQVGRNTNTSASTQGTGRERQAEPTGMDGGSRSNAQYRGAGCKPGPNAWGTEAQGTHDNNRKDAGRQCRAWRRCQGNAGGTSSPQTATTELARIAQNTVCQKRNAVGQQQPCRLAVSSTARLIVRTGRLLTNRMTESVTYGSVGGGGTIPPPTRQNRIRQFAAWRFAR